LNLEDLMQTDARGRGVINILAADKLMQSPKLYATFLLWMLSELFETLPEVGDPDKPKLIFFFDEAHLLFDGDVPKVLEDKIEQVVRSSAQKASAFYFVTQNPSIFPRPCWASSAAGCSTRSGHIRQRTRKRLRSRRKRSAPIPISTRQRSSPSLP
jgi:hypothetical protein